MNCETVRNRVMALPDPGTLPGPLAAHLSGCAACEAWHRLLVRVEATVAATAPAAGAARAKRQLVAQFREPAPAAPKPATKTPAKAKFVRPAGTVVPAPERQSVGERLARLWPAGLVAAALLAGVLVWSSLRGKPDGPIVAALPPDPFLERVVTAKVRLDSAPDAAGRLAALDVLERTIHEEATTLSKVTPGADMDALARMYEQVVTGGMVEQARLMSDDEKKAKLPSYKNRLVDAEQVANRMAAEAPPGADRPLKEIARAAEKGRIELARMIQG
jgi:hypothetical protein